MRWVALAILAVACNGGEGPDDVTEGTPPVVVIDDPDDGDVVSDPASVRLVGRGDDAEDGELGDASLVWSSDRDGDLGHGALLTTGLSVGAHTITLTGTDSDGDVGTDTVSLVVRGENTAPVATILAPADGFVLREGEALVLEGAGNDDEDGDLPGASLVWASSVDRSIGSGTTVTLPSPSLGDHIITLTVVDSEGLPDATSITVTVAAVGQNVSPRVTITNPTDGAQVDPAVSVAFDGSATDPEDGVLPGNRLTWSSSLQGALGTGEHVDATLNAGAHTITLTAVDDDGLAGSRSILVLSNAPGNTPPVAEITAPTNGATVQSTDLVALVGTGVDDEDGALSGAALVWSSDLDGPLGTGSPLDVTGLTEGRHRVTLTVTDSAGGLGVDGIDLFVLVPNARPTVSITTPADGADFTQGDPVSFTATATDPEDGALTGASLTWASNLDGVFGSGEALVFSSLTAGTHRVTVTAADSGGAVASDTHSVTIDVAPVNLVPVAQLSADATGAVGVATTVDAAASYDPDGTIVSYAFNFGDGSAVITGASSTADRTWAQPGTYTITLTVTDNDGATDAATASIDVVIPPRVPEVAHDDTFELGSWCALEVDSSDVPHVLYKHLGHSQVWYAKRGAGGWTRELVEGPGFGVGGLAGGHGSIAVDPSGVVHAAYFADGEAHYARRTTAGAWSIEVPALTPAAVPLFPIAIALDPSQGNRPTMAWTVDAAEEDPIVAWRTGAGTWSTSRWNAPVSQEYGTRGGLAFRANGQAALSVNEDDVGVLLWSAASGFGTFEAVIVDQYDEYTPAPVAFDDQGRPLVAHTDGLSHRVSAWELSYVANTQLRRVGFVWDPVAIEPVLAFQNDQGNLEILRPDGRDYWTWDYQGPMDSSTDFEIDVESDGDVRACFFRSGNLVVY